MLYIFLVLIHLLQHLIAKKNNIKQKKKNKSQLHLIIDFC